MYAKKCMRALRVHIFSERSIYFVVLNFLFQSIASLIVLHGIEMLNGSDTKDVRQTKANTRLFNAMYHYCNWCMQIKRNTLFRRSFADNSSQCHFPITQMRRRFLFFILFLCVFFVLMFFVFVYINQHLNEPHSCHIWMPLCCNRTINWNETVGNQNNSLKTAKLFVAWVHSSYRLKCKLWIIHVGVIIFTRKKNNNREYVKQNTGHTNSKNWYSHVECWIRQDAARNFH